MSLNAHHSEHQAWHEESRQANVHLKLSSHLGSESVSLGLEPPAVSCGSFLQHLAFIQHRLDAVAQSLADVFRLFLYRLHRSNVVVEARYQLALTRFSCVLTTEHSAVPTLSSQRPEESHKLERRSVFLKAEGLFVLVATSLTPSLLTFPTISECSMPRHR